MMRLIPDLERVESSNNFFVKYLINIVSWDKESLAAPRVFHRAI
jgi:hypothetical protein